MISITNNEAHNPNLSNHYFSSLISPYILLRILTENTLIALQWEAIFVHAFFNLNNITRKILPTIKGETFPQLKRPEETISESCWEKINIGNVENLKTVEQAGKKKRTGKKLHRPVEKTRMDQAGKAQREAEEKERLRKWEECWQKKFEAQEERDNAECCAGKDLCVKPRTQSNIWINVTKDRSLQEIHMFIKHVPVPKPKPPPLPPLKIQKTPIISPMERIVKQRVDKMSGTDKKMKKEKKKK
ncbi:uncharacterized protein LOC117233835 [Bombus vosnesenskii]|uniref:Uncharacterized protein LOC117233835 n=1 Tax=Bombus vosnesenskii TaxID=207650 RepID=A0A6J3KB72_9HYME|nr:uncharacterized protein LOC117233835 [Bombus vosnesenskii]